jgi:hypothetical protein
MLRSNYLPNMLIIAVLAAIATPQPLLPPPWVPATPTAQDMYARYTLPETDGTDSIVSAIKVVCDCSVTELQGDLVKDLTAPGVTITQDTEKMCGVDAAHIVAVGVAKPDDSSSLNEDAYIFRQGPAAYFLQYRFRYQQPKPDEEKALQVLCP